MLRPRLLLLFSLLAAFVRPAFPLGIFERPVKLSGTVIEHPSPALDFTLTDQDGRSFRMADTRGKVVVLTFIYTHCTDLCPFVALKLKSAVDLLGADAANKAVFVAVTTDPQRDTQKVISAYSKAVGLAGAWHFLTGPVAEVKEVWFNYGVGVEIEKAPAEGEAAPATVADVEPTEGLSASEATQARGIAAAFGGGYEVGHSTPIWIIDRAGKIRATMDADTLPSNIAANVRALMAR
jgi:cytochrome oxidase Cu insertion factor (SCO1/SenC/PrrC family)